MNNQPIIIRVSKDMSYDSNSDVILFDAINAAWDGHKNDKSITITSEIPGISYQQILRDIAARTSTKDGYTIEKINIGLIKGQWPIVDRKNKQFGAILRLKSEDIFGNITTVPTWIVNKLDQVHNAVVENEVVWLINNQTSVVILQMKPGSELIFLFFIQQP